MQGFRRSGVSTGVDDLTYFLSDPRLRWSAVAAVVIVWLAAAWDDAVILLLLGAPGAVIWLARRHPWREDTGLDDLL